METEIVTGVEAPIEAPATAPETPVEAGQEVVAEPTVEDSPEGDLPAPKTFDEIVAENEDARTSYELKLAEAQEAGRRQHQGEVQPRLERAEARYKEGLGHLLGAAQGVQEIRDLWNRAYEEGTLTDQGIQQIIARHPQAWQALNNTAADVGRYTAMRTLAAQMGTEIGGEAGAKFTGDHVAQWFNAEGGFEDDNDVLSTQMKAYGEALTEKAKAPLQNRIKALEKQIEQAKASGGKQGPATVSGTAGGGRPTPTQYNAATSEQRAKWREDGIEPQT